MKSLVVFATLLSTSWLGAADITMTSQLSSQSQSRTISPRPLLEGQSNILFGMEEFKRIKLLCGDNNYGNGSRINLGLQYGFTSKFSLGISSNLITEKSQTIDTDRPLPTSKGELSIELQLNIVDTEYFSLGINPFLEIATSDKNHFLLKSKDTAGAIVAAQLGSAPLSLTGNLYFRYRPVDIYEDYRISHDWGSSAMIRSELGIMGIYGEIAEQNTEYMSIHSIHDGYDFTTSQLHSVGIDFRIENTKVAFFSKKAIKGKALGVPEQSYGIQLSISLGTKKPDLPDEIKIPAPKPEMSPGEKIYWLDNMREEMAEKKDTTGTEMDGFNLLEEGPSTPSIKKSPSELIKEGDREIEALGEVEERIQLKYGQFESEDEEESLPFLKSGDIQPSISH